MMFHPKIIPVDAANNVAARLIYHFVEKVLRNYATMKNTKGLLMVIAPRRHGCHVMGICPSLVYIYCHV